MRILVLNCGSSSLKFQLFDWPASQPLLRGSIERIGESKGSIRLQLCSEGESFALPERQQEVATHREAVALVAAMLQEHSKSGAPDLIGHRVVHGGERYFEPTRITPQVLQGIRELIPLAPLHNPANVIGIEACLERFSETPQVAVFDTGFHHTLPEKAFRYALPEELYESHHIRRYGFHGTSHAYVARTAAEFIGLPASQANLIILHLGNGASACAVRNGQSVDTSLGFTPLEGLIMGTRSGDIDPAIPFFLAREAKMSFEQIEQLLTSKSGLRGLCGLNDMRDVETRAASGDVRAQRALEMFCYRIRKYIGAYCAVLGRVDALVFTAGIGEHSATVRRLVCADLNYLGVSMDPQRNQAPSSGIRALQTEGSKIALLVVPTNEELEIARASVELLGVKA